jgi:hypothetical protein
MIPLFLGASSSASASSAGNLLMPVLLAAMLSEVLGRILFFAAFRKDGV